MNDKLTLQELIDLLAARHQMEPQDADAFVREFWTLIEEGLKSDNYVKIKGLGTFKLIDTEARESINIQTGERIEIQSHARVTFSPEASLRDLINRPFAHFETVVLNENTNFDDLEEGDVKTEAEPEAEPEEMELAVEEEAAAQEEAVSEPVSEPVSEVVEEETPTPAEEAPADSTETITDVNEEQKQSEGFCKKSKRRLSWCIIACSTLLGVVIGGLSTIYLVGTKYDKLISTRTVESVVSSILDKKEIVADSLKLCVDSITKESVSEDLNSDKSVVIPTEKDVEEVGKPVAQPAAETVERPTEKSAGRSAAQSVEKPAKQVAKPKEKPVYLSETIEYKITGTIATHTLRNGETLTRVALKYYGNKKIWPYLVMHNKDIIKNPDNVPIGTTIRVPKLEPKVPR